MPEYIYVLGIDGKPQMPTKRRRHVNKLLNTGKARIAEHVPFTIQLLYENEPVLQQIMMAEDPGRTNIGAAVVGLKGQLSAGSCGNQEQRNPQADGQAPGLPQGIQKWGTESKAAQGKTFWHDAKGWHAHAETAPVQGRWLYYLPCDPQYRGKVLQPETSERLGDTNGRTSDQDASQPGA